LKITDENSDEEVNHDDISGSTSHFGAKKKKVDNSSRWNFLIDVRDKNQNRPGAKLIF
jgi:hypothetical protein